MRIVTLQWVVGIYCALLGAMMISVPNQFETPAPLALQAHLFWMGTGFLLTGFGLVAASARVLPWWLSTGVHATAGTFLLVQAHASAYTGVWPAAANFGLLGLGTALAPLCVPRSDPGGPDRGRDLFALVMGAAAVANGLIILAFPNQVAAPVYDVARPHLGWSGGAFLVTGVALVVLVIFPRTPSLLRRVGYLVAAFPLFAFLILVAWPARSWMGVLYYGGLGAALALLPWIGPFLERLDPSSLRARFALALAVSMAVPLLVAVSVVTYWEVPARVEQEMRSQQILATALAQDVQDFIAIHQSAVAMLAVYPGLSRMTPDRQREILRIFSRSYPDAVAFVTIDASGNTVARSDDLPRLSAAGTQIFEGVRRANGPSHAVVIGPSIHRPVMQFGTAIHDPRGAFAGSVGVVIEPKRIASTLARASLSTSGDVYLVDERGRVIAYRDPAGVPSLTDFSGRAPVTAVLASGGARGGLRYTLRGEERLAGYAQIPELGWGAVVERPLAAAVAGANSARELAFAVHLVLVGGAILIGVTAAGLLTRPLEALAREATRLGEGDPAASLPESGVAEVANLSAAFEEMRTRLAARTAERERAEEALRDHARELARSNAELEEFAYVASHDLQEPLRMIKSYLQLLQKRHGRKLDGDAHQFLAYAVDGASRMQQLINDLLAYSRVGTTKAEPAPTHCGVALEGVLEDLKMTLDESRGAVTHDPLPTVMGDAPQIRQLFQNLIANAIKFRNSVPPHVHVSAERRGGEWVFSVHDNGIGIAPEYAERIFVIFQRLHTRTEYPGTGIGLAICKKIVERHGGRIWVESQPGQGATFRFTIPDPAPTGHA
jgi:signal transduction histidine kinase